MSRHLYFRVQESNDLVAFQSCWQASSLPFPDFREEFVNSRDAAMSFIWYAIFAAGSSCCLCNWPDQLSTKCGKLAALPKREKILMKYDEEEQEQQEQHALLLLAGVERIRRVIHQGQEYWSVIDVKYPATLRRGLVICSSFQGRLHRPRT
jgi:hypothetical protein